MQAARSVVKHEEKILSIGPHTFGDASGKGISAVVYAVVKQPSGVNSSKQNHWKGNADLG